MTTQVAIKREVEKLKEKTGTKEPRYLYVTLWTGLYKGDPKNVVKTDGEWTTIKVNCVE